MRPERAEHQPHGSRRLVRRLEQIRHEVMERGLRPAAAWAEVMAAMREMDRAADRERPRDRRA